MITPPPPLHEPWTFIGAGFNLATAALFFGIAPITWLKHRSRPILFGVIGMGVTCMGSATYTAFTDTISIRALIAAISFDLFLAITAAGLVASLRRGSPGR